METVLYRRGGGAFAGGGWRALCVLLPHALQVPDRFQDTCSRRGYGPQQAFPRTRPDGRRFSAGECAANLRPDSRCRGIHGERRNIRFYGHSQGNGGEFTEGRECGGQRVYPWRLRDASWKHLYGVFHLCLNPRGYNQGQAHRPFQEGPCRAGHGHA